MKVRSRIHNREERLQQRLMADRSCHRCLLRFLCVVSVLRSVLTLVAPAAGSASWWLVPVLLIPGTVCTVVVSGCMRATKTTTLGDCVRRLLGCGGSAVVGWMAAVLLLVDGITTITTLVCFFVEGIHTVGTQVVMTLLTCAVLVWCLDQAGLPRGIWLLKWVMLAAAVVVAANLVGMAKIDHLYPLLGNGERSVLEAVKAGAGLSWPLLLLLTQPPVREGTSHMRELPLPLLSMLAGTALLLLAFSNETLTSISTLAQALTLPVMYLHPAVKMLMQCLLMLALFLLLSAQAHTAYAQVKDALPRRWVYFPHAMVVVIGLTQLLPIKRLWSVLRMVQPWLLLPPVALTLVLLIKTILWRRSDSQ